MRNEAEKELTKLHKIIGFRPVLLQVIMSNEVELPTRRAAVIYLNNMVNGSWVNREPDTPGQCRTDPPSGESGILHIFRQYYMLQHPILGTT